MSIAPFVYMLGADSVARIESANEMSRRTKPQPLREELVDAALKLVEANGIEGFSMREAARMAGVSSGAPYRHYKDNDALLRAAACRVVQLISEVQREAAARYDVPALRFRAIGTASVRFAVEHPELFRLANDRRYLLHDDPETKVQLDSMRKAVRVALDLSAKDGAFDEEQAPALIQLTVESATYGLARLFLDGHLPCSGPAEAEQVAESVLNLLGTGFLQERLPAGDPRSWKNR